MAETQTPKRSDTDPMILRLKAFAAHPKTPRLAGRVALGLANHRTNVSDWSERTIGAASPLKARIDTMQARQEAGLEEITAKLTEQDARLREQFGPVIPSITVPDHMPESPKDTHDQVKHQQ